MVVAHSATPVTRKKTRRSLVKRRGKAVNATIQTKSTLEPVTVDEPAPVMDDAREDDEVMIDVDPESAPTPSAVPSFSALPTSASSTTTPKSETRRVPIPPHRMTPIKKDWVNIFSPLTEILGLQVRMNVPRRCVEIRVSFFWLLWLIHPRETMIFSHQNTPKMLVRYKKVQTSSRHMHWGLM